MVVSSNSFLFFAWASAIKSVSVFAFFALSLNRDKAPTTNPIAPITATKGLAFRNSNATPNAVVAIVHNVVAKVCKSVHDVNTFIESPALSNILLNVDPPEAILFNVSVRLFFSSNFIPLEAIFILASNSVNNSIAFISGSVPKLNSIFFKISICFNRSVICFN